MHRSGIQVDEELKKAFVDAQAGDSVLFIKIRVVNDTFKSVDQGNVKGDEKSNFDALAATLKPGEPCYLVTRAGQSKGKWLCIFYVPENSLVKEKMIYASSVSGLREGLGGSAFVPDFAISTPAECSLSEYQRATKEHHENDILTLEEISKREERSAASAAQAAVKSVAIADVPIVVSDEAQAAIKDVLGGKSTAALFAIDAKTEVLKLEASGNLSVEELAKRMPAKEPRYALHQFAHEQEGKAASALLFLYYCPDASPPRMKMTYSTCKSMLVKYAEGLGAAIAKQLEASELPEIAPAAFLAELYPKSAEKKVVAKPKKPGKGGARLTGGTKFSADKK